jgi:integrase
MTHEAVARQLGHATAEYVPATYGHVSEWDAAQEFERVNEREPMRLLRAARAS